MTSTVAASADPVIAFHGLTRYFGRFCAVDRVSLTIPRGRVFGLLGRNGSGKTTLIRMLLGLLEPTRGSATLLGRDCGALDPGTRARVGYLAEGHQVYGWMRVHECIAFQRRYFATWNQALCDGICEHFRLAARTKARDLSRGQRAGLCLALALAPEPELLILDDPALGLDPVARRTLLESMVYATRREDRTILFSSHYLGDVERVADDIAVLDHGRLRACSPLETFRQRIGQYVLRFDGPPPSGLELPGLLDVDHQPGGVRVTLVDSDGMAPQRLSELAPTAIDAIPLELEDAFIRYVDRRPTGRSFLDATETD